MEDLSYSDLKAISNYMGLGVSGTKEELLLKIREAADHGRRGSIPLSHYEGKARFELPTSPTPVELKITLKPVEHTLHIEHESSSSLTPGTSSSSNAAMIATALAGLDVSSLTEKGVSAETLAKTIARLSEPVDLTPPKPKKTTMYSHTTSGWPKLPVAPGTAKLKKKAPRGKNAYMFYLASHSANIIAEILAAANSVDASEEDKAKVTLSGKVKVAEVAKIAGAKWKAISAEEKAPFEELAAVDKVDKLKAFEEEHAVDLKESLAWGED